METAKLVSIVPCAGLEKAPGFLTCYAAFEVVEKLRPNTTSLVAITPLMENVESSVRQVKTHPVIVVDGCPQRCATKLTVKKGGRIRGRVFIPCFIQKHSLKPISASDLGAEGLQLVSIVAQDIAVQVDRILAK
ncbi:MAG: putative zinc-binding protein [Candidatus Ranarchaeia archaeon]